MLTAVNGVYSVDRISAINSSFGVHFGFGVMHKNEFRFRPKLCVDSATPVSRRISHRTKKNRLSRQLSRGHNDV